MFLPKIVSTLVANNHINHRLVANKELIRRCDSRQLIRFFSSVEETAETNEIEVEREVPIEKVDPRKRTLVVTPEQSIRYLESEAYKASYGHHKVWHLFRRNFKGRFSPWRSRDKCIVDGMVWTSNPCPICRDEYLVLHYSNLKLINQFINPFTGYVYENTVLCLCAEKYEKLLVAVNLAKNYGLLTFEMPLRTFDYRDYYKPSKLNHNCNQHKH